MKLSIPGSVLDGAAIDVLEKVDATNAKPGGILVELREERPPAYVASTELRGEDGTVLVPSVMPRLLVSPLQIDDGTDHEPVRVARILQRRAADREQALSAFELRMYRAAQALVAIGYAHATRSPLDMRDALRDWQLKNGLDTECGVVGSETAAALGIDT